VLLALMIQQRAKVYYLGPAYPVLFAAGAVALTDFFARRGWRFAPACTALFIVAAGLVGLPLAIPILSPERFLSYSAALGVGEPKMEREKLGRMPQIFAFMFGWEELAREVARVYQTLSPQEQVKAVVLGRNYAEAGAIDYYGPALGLPPAISPHNSYWTWGPGAYDGEVLIVIGAVGEDVAARFDSFELRGHRSCEYCAPYEAELDIYVARGLRVPVSDAWAGIKHYE
jgi:hypothetical protein